MTRKFRRWWKRLFGTSALTRAAVVTPEPAQRKRMKIAPSAAVVSKYVNNGEAIEAFTLPEPPEGVVNRAAQVDGHALLAMDDMNGLTEGYAQTAYSSFFKEGLGFLGYPYLAELSQRTEYRRPVEIIAKEMTRKWIKFTAVGDGDKSEKIKLIEADFKKFSVRELFRKAAEGDGYMGRHHLFIRTGDNDQPQELVRPLIADPRKYAKGFLKGFTSVEAMWAYPSAFNATNPLEPDYYRPPMWFVQGQTIHATRLLTFVSRPMPDMLKPAYAFGGLALTQIMKPYVDNWLETRQSVNDLIQLFSQAVLKTDMQAVLEGDGADDLMRRVDLFNRTRSNRGTMVLDMNAEDFINVSAPISGLDKLQAQAQEHMAAACGIPLVVLLGVTPSGLNASSDGEIRTFYQWVRDVQEQLFLPNLTIVLQLIQLNLFGEIDPAIGIEFEPLWEDDAATKATTGKAKADTAAVYINAGVVDPEEERQRLAHDEDGMYAGVDLSGPPPEPPADPAEEGDPEAEEDAQAADAWNEGDHPRAENGEFGSGGPSDGPRLPYSSSLSVPPPPSSEQMQAHSRVEEVPLGQTRATQTVMHWDKFSQGEHPGEMVAGFGDMPVAVRKEDGEYLIFDGHHRTAKAKHEGATSLKMHVIDAKSYAPQYAGRKPNNSGPSADDLLRDLLAD